MLSGTYYSQNHASIIRPTLIFFCGASMHCLPQCQSQYKIASYGPAQYQHPPSTFLNLPCACRRRLPLTQQSRTIFLVVAPLAKKVMYCPVHNSMLFMVTPLRNFIMIRITCQLHSFILCPSLNIHISRELNHICCA